MTLHRRITPCERFEEIRFKPNDQFTDADFQFMAEHIENCPLGIHTEEALNQFLKMKPEEIWSNGFEEPLPSIEDPAFEERTNRVTVESRIYRANPQMEETVQSRRTFLRPFALAVTLPVASFARGLMEPGKTGWIAEVALREFQQQYAKPRVSPNRLEMLAHLLKPAGVTNYSAARNHPRLPQAGPGGYSRDRRAIEAFMQFEPRLPNPRPGEGEGVVIGPGENLVIAGSPRSNDEAKLFLPYRDMSADNDRFISNTFEPSRIPYHFVIGEGEVWSQTIATDHWEPLPEPTFAIARPGGDFWQPREPVDKNRRLKTDFLLVSRLPHSPSGGDIIIIAGGQGAGTEAFRLLFDEAAFPLSQFLLLFRMLEGKQHFQFVLECHDITHTEEGSQAHRLAIPDDCPPVVIPHYADLFKKP